MHLNKNLITALICAVGVFFSSHAQKKISGTVMSNGTMISGASVKLAVAGDSTTTGSGGTWSMDVTSIKQVKTNAAYQGPFMTGNTFYFTVKGEVENVRINVCDLRGRLIHCTMDRKLSRGTYSLKPLSEGLNSQVYILNARIGKKSIVAKIPVIGSKRVLNNLIGSMDIIENSEIMAGNRKAMIDTIVANKAGYIEGRKAIAEYSGTHVIMLTQIQPE